MNKNSLIVKKIEEAQEAIAAALEEIEKSKTGEAKAFCGVEAAPEPCCKSECRCDCSYDLKYIKQELEYLWKRIANHEENHLPQVKSMEQLKRAIKALGLEEEYEVVPQRIYAEDGKFLGENLVLKNK
jgi:hypothetical protein